MQALGFVWRNAPRRQFNLTHREEIVRYASHGGAIALLEAWGRLRLRGGMVLGRDFPTRPFAGLLSDAILFERRADHCEFRVRLAGFAMQCFHGFDITGKTLADFLSEGEGKRYRSCLNAVLRRGEPSIMLAEACCAGETLLKREIVSLPVRTSDLKTPLVLAISFWKDKRWLN